MTNTQKRVRLREIFTRPGCTPSLVAHDALSARILEDIGYEVISQGSMATAISQYALPDIRLLTLKDYTEAIRKINDSVDIPVMCDWEDGFYNPDKIWYAVREYENAGAASLQMEDLVPDNKHTAKTQALYPTGLVCDKIKAAVDARQDESMMILARNDAYVHNNPQDTIERLNCYLEAGADGVVIIWHKDQWSLEGIGKIRGQIRGPVQALLNKGDTLEMAQKAGINIAGQSWLTLYSSLYAVKQAAEVFYKTGSNIALGEYIIDERLMDYYLPHYENSPHINKDE